jgi:hypothetical protein
MPAISLKTGQLWRMALNPLPILDRFRSGLNRGRGRQRRGENGVKMAWHIHTWAEHSIFTSSLMGPFHLIYTPPYGRGQ